MSRNINIIQFVLLLLIVQNSFAFENSDSIRIEFNALDSIANIDTLLNKRLELIKYVEKSDYSLYLELANKNIELSKKENINWGQVDIYMELGESFIKRGNYGIALNNLNQALKLAEIDPYRPYVGWVTLAIGNCYEAMLNPKRAIEFYQISLQVFTDTKEEEGIAMASTNIGNNYMVLSDFDNARKFLEIGLEKRTLLEDPIELGYVKMYLARVDFMATEYEHSKETLLTVIQDMNAVIHNKKGFEFITAKSLVGEALLLIAECEDALGLKNEKFKHLFEAEIIYKELNDNLNLSLVYNIISRNYFKDQQFEKSIIYADSALSITKNELILNEQAVANKILAEIYEELEDYQLSLKYQKEFKMINDSMYNQSVTDAISNVDVLVETITKEKDNQILKIQIANEKKIRNIIIAGTWIFIIMLFLVILNIFQRYKKGKKYNYELIQKNDEIIEQRKRLETMNLELNLLLKSKDKFNSIIAHDLRNPIGSVFSITELLSSSYDELTDSQRKELIDGSVKTSEQTLKLLENLLTWSRLQGGHLKLKKSIFEITHEVDETIKSLKYLSDVKSINVNVEHNGKIELFADKEMILTVIRNLFTNAVKFTPDGKKITVGIQREKEKIEIWIQDEGIGIPDDKIKQLFLIDSQIQRPGTNKEPGTGLGLQLANEFVKLHNGYFKVESEVQKGSKFSFYIPLTNK